MLETAFAMLPLWGVLFLSAALFVISSEVGFFIGRYRRQHKDMIESGTTGIVTGSILGLVSFMLAFTFGIAASHHSERRGVVLDEANAIGTAYLRADFLPEDQADAVRTYLQDYTEARVSVAAGSVTVSDYFKVIRASEDIHKELWELVSAAARDNPTPVTALAVVAVNDVIDVHSLRVAAGVRHAIPTTIWVALFAISAIAMATTGYRMGVSFKKRSELMPGLVIAFASIITLIADLDHPSHGFLLNDHTPMKDLLLSMQSF